MMKIRVLLSIFLFLQSPHHSSSTGTPTHNFYTTGNTGTVHQPVNQMVWSPIESKKEDGIDILHHRPHHQTLIQSFNGNAATSSDNSYIISEPKTNFYENGVSGISETGGGLKSYSGPSRDGSSNGDQVESEAIVQFYQRPIGYEITSTKGIQQYGGDGRGGIESSFTGGETFPSSSHGDIRAKPVTENNNFQEGYSRFQAQKQNEEVDDDDPNKNFEEFKGFGIDEENGDFRQDFSEDYIDKDYDHHDPSNHHQTHVHDNNHHDSSHHHQTHGHDNNHHEHEDSSNNNNNKNNQRNHGVHGDHSENEYTEPSNSFYGYNPQDYKEEVNDHSGPSAKSPVKFNPYGGFQVFGNPSDSSYEHETFNKSPSGRENFHDHHQQQDYYNGPGGAQTDGRTRDRVPTLSERIYDHNPLGMKYKQHASTRDKTHPRSWTTSFITP